MVMRGLALAIPLIFVAACSQIERAKLVNDTGAPIVFRLSAVTSDGRDAGHDVLVTLKPGESKVFKGGRLRGDRLEITAARCRYAYRLGGDDLWRLREEGERPFPIELRLKRDFALHLPPGKHRAALHAPETFGFPRPAISKHCG